MLRDVPVQLCHLERRSLQQWLRPKDLPNPKLSPTNQPLPILVSCLVVETLAHASLVERPGIGVLAAPR